MEEKKLSRTIEIVGREECTGCGACFNLCPLNAIKMTLDNNGFLQPVINKEICIDCGMCLKKCPVINSKYVNSEKPICYAVSASDEVKKIVLLVGFLRFWQIIRLKIVMAMFVELL